MVNYYLVGVINNVVCKRITARAGEVSEYYQTSCAGQYVKKNICRHVK